MFTDTNDIEVTYWPISGLAEGEETPPQVFRHATPRPNGRLSCEAHDKLIIWGRVEGVGSYVNLATTGIDLTGLAGPTTDFELKAEALTPIVGLERVSLNVSTGESGPAGWVD